MNYCTPEELKSFMDRQEKMLILDVRTLEEYDVSRISQSFHCSLDQLTVERIHEALKLKGLVEEDLIVITCKVGPRAIKAYGFLKDHFNNLHVLQGCTDAWIKSNFPVEGG